MITAEPSAAAARRRGLWSRIVDRVGTQNLSLLLALVILVAIFGSLRPDVFFLPRNLVNIGLAITILGILAMAADRGDRLRRARHLGRLDRRPGHDGASRSPCRRPAAPRSASAPALGAAALAGLVNGLIITYGRVNAVIATLGTMAAFRGFAFLTSGGSSVSIVNEQFRVLGNGVLLVPAGADPGAARRPGVVFAVFLSTTVVGRNIYAIGGNPTVARLAGIPIRRYQIGIYILSRRSPPASPALLLASRTMSGQPASGSQGLELEAITAAILGGCALAGRQGHHRRRAARRADHRRAQQRPDPDQRADLLPADRQGRPADRGGDDPGAAAAAGRRGMTALALRAGVHRDVVRRLGLGILEGTWPPGGRLPNEADLCARFQVSRTALREAVRFLAAKGLIEARPRLGMVVRARDSWNLLDPQLLAWQREWGTFDPDLVRSLAGGAPGGRAGGGGAWRPSAPPPPTSPGSRRRCSA